MNILSKLVSEWTGLLNSEEELCSLVNHHSKEKVFEQNLNFIGMCLV